MNSKHYLKCPHCLRLVEIQSQYMVLCPECKRKLTNSFSIWQHSNTEGTYDQYLSEVCVSEAAVAGLDEQRKIGRQIKRSNTFKRLAIAFSIAVGLFLAISAVLWFSRGTSDNSVQDILDNTWKMNYYEDLKATVQFPFALKPAIDTTFEVPDSAIQVKKIVARQWIKPTVCNITAMRMEYTDDKSVDRESATGQIFQSIVGDNGMQAFQFIPSDYEVAGTKARMMTGSYLIETELYEFRAVLIVRNDEVWYFMVAYPNSKPEGTMLAEKLFRTIQLQ